MRVRLLNPHTPRTNAVIFDAGDEVMSGWLDFAAEHEIDAASLTAIGGFSTATLAYFDVDAKKYEDIPVDEQVEVLTSPVTSPARTATGRCTSTTWLGCGTRRRAAALLTPLTRPPF